MQSSRIENLKFKIRLALHFLVQSLPKENRSLSSYLKALGLPSILSIVGLIVGVASLTVSMGVVSSYERTLKTAITEVYGHVLVVDLNDGNSGTNAADIKEIETKIRKVRSDLRAISPMITLEGIVVSRQKLHGVVMQGFDFSESSNSIDHVLDLQSRMIHGHYPPRADEAIVGRALASRYSLQEGSDLTVVIPRPSRQSTGSLDSKILKLKVAGVVDLGKYEVDERGVVIPIEKAREQLLNRREKLGFRLRIDNAEQAHDFAREVRKELGDQYWISDWTEGNKNLLKAIEYERVPIFFVIFVIMIAASFNVSSNIFVSVLRRTHDIAVFRALGLSARDASQIFQLQGLAYAVFGTILGVLFGLALGLGFIELQNHFGILPAAVYRLARFRIEIHWIEIVIIFISALLLCWLASWAPARRAARLNPIEGLRFE